MNTFSFTGKQLFFVLSLAILVPASAVVAHEWMAPKEAADMENQIATNAESIARGKELFLDNCAACHGDKAKGLTADEAGLEKSTPNLPQRLASHTDGDFFWKIQHGRGDMPSFKESLSSREIWDIINFIKDN